MRENNRRLDYLMSAPATGSSNRTDTPTAGRIPERTRPSVRLWRGTAGILKIFIKHDSMPAVRYEQTARGIVTSQEKRPYTPPELTRYGDIEELTKGDGQGSKDAGGLGQKS